MSLVKRAKALLKEMKELSAFIELIVSDSEEDEKEKINALDENDEMDIYILRLYELK